MQHKLYSYSEIIYLLGEIGYVTRGPGLWVPMGAYAWVISKPS